MDQRWIEDAPLLRLDTATGRVEVVTGTSRQITAADLIAAIGQLCATVQAEPPCPENRATAIALADARRWQEARRAVRAGAGMNGSEGPHPAGLGWEEI